MRTLTARRKTFLELINRECDSLRGFLRLLADGDEFTQDECDRIKGAIYALDRASVSLCGHINRQVEE